MIVILIIKVKLIIVTGLFNIKVKLIIVTGLFNFASGPSRVSRPVYASLSRVQLG
jgi:hypothetical protein